MPRIKGLRGHAPARDWGAGRGYVPSIADNKDQNYDRAPLLCSRDGHDYQWAQIGDGWEERCTECDDVAPRYCISGSCFVAPERGEVFCPFHDELIWKLDLHGMHGNRRSSIPLNKDGKWDGFGNFEHDERQKDVRADDADEARRSFWNGEIEKSPKYARRRSKFADVISAVVRCRAGVRWPIPGDVDPSKWRNQLSSTLSHNRLTLHTRWSVRRDGSFVVVKRIGEWDAVA